MSGMLAQIGDRARGHRRSVYRAAVMPLLLVRQQSIQLEEEWQPYAVPTC